VRTQLVHHNLNSFVTNDINKSTKPYSALLVTSHCVEKIAAERVGQGEVGVSPTRCCAHGTARLGYERVMVGTGWATSHPDCMDMLRKHYSHLVGSWFLARKVVWAMSGCMAIDSVDHCMLMNEWAWSKL